MPSPAEPEFDEAQDMNSRAVYALGHMMRWVLDGSNVEVRPDGAEYKNQADPRQVIAARFLALVLLVRPELLREQVSRKLGKISRINYSRLIVHCQDAEKAFGYIAPRRDRATRPHINGFVQVSIAEGETATRNPIRHD